MFWFLFFISTSLIIIALSIAFIQQREHILHTNNLIKDSYLAFLSKIVAQKDFLSYDTKNGDFFEYGESQYLDEYEMYTDSVLVLLEAAQHSIGNGTFGIGQEFGGLMASIKQIDSVFYVIVDKLKLRGYKDFTLEGRMRADAHWLETVPEIPAAEILTLRRHEKDYIIRNESKYVEQLNNRVEQIRAQLNKKELMPSRREEIESHLYGYQMRFNQLVSLDREIGIKDNTALKLDLDNRISELELGFQGLLQKARKRKQTMFFRLTMVFFTLAVSLLLISLWLSYVISKRITRPLKDLTVYITRFVDSSFTLEEENPKVRTKDEIGKLTENFSILKQEIINRLQYFKEKVDERTQELASANQKLRHINESNRRFVPQEFIHFLGKKSIEEVHLGDQIQQEMTLMFTDIRKFTQLSETLSPQENFDFINSYFDNIVPAIQQNNGIIDKFIGDSVMALFPEGPEWALRSILAFEQALKDFNEKLITQGMAPIRIGTGIHTGQMILGTIGNNERLQTTVISDAVNIASRVEGLTKFYKANTIFTEETLSHLPPDHVFEYRFLDFVKVKGKSKVISIYELISPGDTKLNYQTLYQEAVRYMREKQIPEATALFHQLYEENPNDMAVKVILDRCNYYLENGLPDQWDGVEEMREK